MGIADAERKAVEQEQCYLIFIRPFYYGEFEYPVGSGNWHNGIHKPMITREEYDRIQVLLGRRTNPRGKEHDIAYRGPIKCGDVEV